MQKQVVVALASLLGACEAGVGANETLAPDGGMPEVQAAVETKCSAGIDIEAGEAGALAEYLRMYPQASTHLVQFGPFRAAAWRAIPGTTTVDPGAYYRAVCNSSAAAAALLDRNGSSPDADWARVSAVVEYVMGEYWDKDSPLAPRAGATGWNAFDGAWNAGFTGTPCALAVALSWNHLSPNGKATAKRTLVDLANSVAAKPISSYTSREDCTNTIGEEVSADASFLSLMSQLTAHGSAQSNAWLAHAKALMTTAYSTGVSLEPLAYHGATCPQPAGVNLSGTVANHALLPNPAYGASLLVDAGASILPFVNANAAYPQELVGGSASSLLGVYAGFLRFTNTADFSFTGIAHQVVDAAGHLGGTLNFASISYLGRSGVGDWGFGADFQNSAFAAAAQVQGIQSTHACLLSYQEHLPHRYGYLPSSHASACAGTAADRDVANWRWDPLAASCDNGALAYSVSLFGAPATTTINAQIDSHLFLNSFKALNHTVALLLAHHGLFPTTAIF